jgi:Ala-tRNA(Pro) deacylase
METATGNEAHGIDAVVGFLGEAGVQYDVVDHRQTFSAAAEARAAGIQPDHAAKTMLLRDGSEYRLAVIPASERLDVRKVREALEGSGHLRLATEDEMSRDFSMFEVGALPPIGPLFPAPEVLDRRLMGPDPLHRRRPPAFGADQPRRPGAHRRCQARRCL